MRRVTLVTGPPCSGKSRYVAEHRAPGAVVVDYDEIARELGSPHRWRHGDRWFRLANDEMQRRTDQVARMTEGEAWVIRTVPRRRDRSRLAAEIHADAMLVLLPPAETLRARARERPEPVWTVRQIDRWFSRYEPAPGDLVLVEVVSS